MSAVKITLLCSDISTNAASRAVTLAEVLQRDFEVRVLGSAFGDGVWQPARATGLQPETVPGMRLPRYARSRRRLLRVLDGDVIYALKPLPTSLGVALAARRRAAAPVVLDVDDDELSFRPRASPRRPRSVAAALAQPNSRLWTRLVERRAGLADGVTVATTGLQRRYGGTLVSHVRDTELLAPRAGERERGRRALGDPETPIVLFAGTPRPFKGIEDLCAAAGRMRNSARLVLAGGDRSDPFVRGLASAHPDLQILPPYERSDLVSLLEAADVVVVPQRASPETEHQLPAKLLDAMALARPTVATARSDIPAILADGRGVVVPPGDVGGLATAIDELLDDPAAAAAMGQRARQWCVEHASYDWARPVLRDLMRRVRATWEEAQR